MSENSGENKKDEKPRIRVLGPMGTTVAGFPFYASPDLPGLFFFEVRIPPPEEEKKTKTKDE
jgi:hypothetical protein